MFGKIAVIQFILILSMIVAGVSYFRYSEKQIATLHENNAKLETAVNTQQATIDAQIKAAQEQSEQMIALQQSTADAESHRRDIEDKLRQKDLAAMARANAADLEMRMNRATIKALQDMINLTTPKDRAVTPIQLETPLPRSTTDSTAKIKPINPNNSNQQPLPKSPKIYNNTGNTP